VTNAAMIATAALPKFVAGKIRRLDSGPSGPRMWKLTWYNSAQMPSGAVVAWRKALFQFGGIHDVIPQSQWESL